VHCAARLARLVANSRLCVNVAVEIWLLLGVNVATTIIIIMESGQFPNCQPNPSAVIVS